MVLLPEHVQGIVHSMLHLPGFLTMRNVKRCAGMAVGEMTAELAPDHKSGSWVSRLGFFSSFLER